MFKFIIYLIITIGIIHFILYYFNFDFKFEVKKTTDIEINDISLNDYINELKTLNECINNGKIDSSIS